MTCFIGYAAFAIAFGISLMYLLKRQDPEGKSLLLERFPEAALLDELTHQMVMFGFLFLSIGIITGAVWANSAWGRYWGWDPKEVWSLVACLGYLTVLHVRIDCRRRQVGHTCLARFSSSACSRGPYRS